MRPILLTTDAVGGVWRYSIDLARGLGERGIPVVLAVMGPGASAGQEAELRAVPGARLVQTGLALDWTAPSAAVLTQASDRLGALAALCGAESVHLHAPALVGAARWPVPVVAVAHSDVGTWWQAMRPGAAVPDDFRWRMDATGRGLRRAAATIAPTAAHAAAVRSVYGDVAMTVVLNGAPALPVAAHGERQQAVLTAGRLWDEAKGAAAIDAVAAGLDVPVRAAGPVCGPDGGAVQLRHLELLGTLGPDGMAQAYAGASVFVSMAHYEPFGLSVLEAAKAGLKLVLSDIPTFRELWDGAATFATPDTLAAALRAALDRPDDGAAKARAAGYTLGRMVDATLAVHRGARA